MSDPGADLALRPPEQTSRWAVTAVTADLEYWARTVSVDGRIGLNDLTRTLEMLGASAVQC